jgi:acetyl-CoA C-acetyltransferase
MTLDLRTPVIVGVGQVNLADGDAPEPVDLLAEAAQRAAGDAGSDRLLCTVDSIRVVRIMHRGYSDPGRLVAERLGAGPRHTAVTTDGGQQPQVLVNRTAADILRGDVDVVLIGGAESWRTRTAYRSRGERPPWTTQPDDARPSEVVGAPLQMFSAAETRLGLSLPIQVYPLFETALRARRGEPIPEHRRRIATLWAGFSAVAAANPFAALRRPLDAEAIGTPGPGNRMIGFPYTKRLCSNNHVDQAAALLLSSVGAARALGVPTDRFVFPWAGTEANDTAFVSQRMELCASPAIRLAGSEALRLAGVGVDDLAFVDVYSCFPSAVQVTAAELGLSLDRPLTVTGGLTFAGGPWNNYVTHAIGTMAGILRRHPDAVGLCTANGGLLTKHAFGVYAARPPPNGFRTLNLQAQVDAVPAMAAADHHQGPVTVEASTVMHDREGRPEQAFIACRTDDGRRAWGRSTDPDLAQALMSEEFAGRRVTIGPESTLRL